MDKLVVEGGHRLEGSVRVCGAKNAVLPVLAGALLTDQPLLVKKKDAKPVIEAMLAVLGEALTDHREINLPELGRIKVRKEKMLPNGRVMITKIRQPLGGAGKKLPDAAE